MRRREATQASASRSPSLVANHLVDSQLERDLTAGGNVSFSASGSSANVTDAAASSAGAKEKSGSGAQDGDGRQQRR